jgi:hypothetical protein
MTLTVAHEPTRILHNGKYLRLSELQAGILAKLVEKGRASFADLHANRDSLKVIVSNMRPKLPAGTSVKPVRGWGYELSGSEM